MEFLIALFVVGPLLAFLGHRFLPIPEAGMGRVLFGVLFMLPMMGGWLAAVFWSFGAPLWAGLVAAVFGGLVIAGKLKIGLFGAGGKGNQIDRGALLIDDKAAQKELQGVDTAAKLGAVPVPVEVEPLHFLMAGAPGSGKSLAFTQLLNSARERKHPAVLADLGGELVSRFYRPGVDVILNPYDARGEDWSPFAEMRQSYDAARLASSMIPEGTGDSKEWNGYARAVLESILERCFESGQATNAALCWYAFGASSKELAKLCEGSPASPYFDDGAERMLGSIRGILSSYLKAYTYLNPNGGADSFSIRDHLEKCFSEGRDSWLFVSYRDDQLQALKPMIAAAIDLAASAILSMKADLDRRCWFALDEFSTLGYINSIEALLTKGRKAGVCAILGYQSISQPRKTYGNDQAQTLLSCLGTWVVLKQPDADSAEYMSKYIGDEEARRWVASENQKDGDKDSHGKTEQIVRQRAIMGSELANLAARRGLVNIAGPLPPAWTTIPIEPTPEKAEPFQERQGVRGMRIERPASLQPLAVLVPEEPPQLPAAPGAKPAPLTFDPDTL